MIEVADQDASENGGTLPSRPIDLGDVAEMLERTNESLSRLARELGQAKGEGWPNGMAAQAGGQSVQVMIWEDDPFSEATSSAMPQRGATIAVDAPTFVNQRMQTAIGGTQAALARHAPGTPQFRFWVAQEALARGIAFWSALLPAGTTWSTRNPMQVQLEAGTDLNAFYSRAAGLRFFGKAVDEQDVFTCESPDVVCHELGHAVLDALKPQLFEAASTEAAAFHEAFGDMSAILCALQLPTMRTKVLSETGGRLNVNSRLSRIAEQLGWAIRRSSPDSVDRDSLRNAANSFFYRRPDLLPSRSPADQLSNRPHNFSRVFTGAFLDALSAMFSNQAADNSATLLAVSRDMGLLLVDGVHTAPIRPTYFSQVAAAMIQADKVRFSGKYSRVLSRAFVKRGILAVDSAMGLAAADTPVLVAAKETTTGSLPHLGAVDVVSYAGSVDDGYLRDVDATPDLPRASVTLGELKMDVHVADESSPFAATSATIGMTDTVFTPADDSSKFIESLIQRGELDLTPPAGAARSEGAAMVESDVTSVRPSKMTHVLASEEGRLVLRRNHFNCGLCGRW